MDALEHGGAAERNPRAAEQPALASECAPRSLVLGAALIGSAAVLCPALSHPKPLLLWNATASSTIGLYAVTSARTIRRGDMAVAFAPGPARRLAASRRYLPSRVPLVKRVAAVNGDRVCARGKRIWVDGRLAAVRRAHDPSGRTMPWWWGCRTLRLGELFLLSRRAPEAFDGRYFGVTRSNEVVGKARLLWAR